MRIQSVLVVSTAFTLISATRIADPILPRQTNTEQNYLNSVCLPNITTPIIPPCQQIANIESICVPNGTLPLDYLAHQQCMCTGGYFANWLGCLNCEYVHGGRSQAQSSAFSQILTSASHLLCTGTPTASFAAIFSSLSDAHPVVASTAGTTTKDLFPSQSAVSLYYTASGPQGPGQITGSATAATKEPASASASAAGSGSAPTETNSGSTPSGGSAGAGGNGAAPSSTSTSSSGAMATHGINGLIGVVAGGMAMAAL